MIEKTFNTGLINLNYAEGTGGSPGSPPVVLIHGLATKWKAFSPLFPEMEKEWRLFAPDLRGHGQSDRVASYRLHDYMEDIVSFCKNCIKEPAILFGHSLGGMISFMVAAKYPELVKALIIGDSAISVEFLKNFSETHKQQTIWWRDLAKTKDFEYILSELKKQLIHVPDRKEPVPAYQIYGEDHPMLRHGAECFSQTDPEVLTADIDYFDETYAEYKIDKLFPQIQCSVLILQANPEMGGLERDEDVEKALSLLSQARHVKLSHVGHLLHLQDREAVLKAIVSFLEAI